MITKRQYSILSYFLSRFLFFGGISYLFSLGGVDTWLATLLGFVLGLLSFKLLHYIYIKSDNKDFLYFFKDNIFIKIITLLLCLLLLNYALLSVSVMTYSFFLFKTSPFFISILLILAMVYGVSKSEKVFARVAELLFPICLVILIFKILGYGSLSLNYIDNLFPFLNTKMSKFFQCVFTAYIYSFVPNILLLSFGNINLKYKEMVKGYFFAGISIVLTIMIVGLIFGYPLVTFLRYPEYMALKKISLFESLKNMENILIMTWEFDCIVSGFIIINSIKKLNKSIIKSKIANLTYIILFLIPLFVSVFVFEKHYMNTIVLYLYSCYVFAALLVIIITYLLYKAIKVKKKEF